MSANPEVEGIVALPATAERFEQAAPLVELAVPAAQAKVRTSKRAWIVTAAVAVIGLAASGTLGYLFYTTVQQRDGLHTRLVAAQTQLAAAQEDAASKKVTATYVAMYVADDGRVQTDYESVVACKDYSSCRTGAQQMLADLQSFQQDRKVAVVPSSLLSTDSSTGDAISAAIAGTQELIVGMDNDNVDKIKEGGAKVDAAMLSLAKAQVSLGSLLK